MAKETSTPQQLSQIKPTVVVGFHHAVHKWYKIHGRHELSWRNTTDPYHIWLSEVMLQQTQVATVRDRFYQPFLTKFPTIEALASAEITDVMKAWEGLGYYSRARNLHKAAKLVASSRARPGPEQRESGDPKNITKPISRNTLPILPTREEHSKFQGIPAQGRDDALLEALLALPGIGRNTAHAIFAFAYHQPVAILEANVKRVVARVFAYEKPSDAELWAGAEALLDRAHPFDYNQAMMDLGSMICTPKAPRCGDCPANRICKGKVAPERYPAPKLKKQVPTREVIIHVCEDAVGRLFLEKRDEKLLGGLYGFPQTPHPTRTPQQDHLPKSSGASTSPKGEVITASLADNASNARLARIPLPRERSKNAGATLASDTHPEMRFSGEGHLGTVTHIYSHFKLIGHVVHEKVAARSNSRDWHSREEIAALPLSKLDHKVLALVEACNSSQKKRAKARRGA